VLGLYPKLMEVRPGAVMGFVSDASFHDIGTPADLLQTSLDLAARDGRPDRPRWGGDCVVDRSARVTRSVLWDRVRIGAGAVIHECVVADDVTIPAGSNYSRCAIAKGDAGLVVETLR
jgi:NDP-sugar pyrophosphorylase family protein